MPNPSKSAGQIPARNLPFEEALKKLEGVVEAMETGDLPLETLLAKYEEGTRLVRFCAQKLDEAEKKIELLTKKADGSVNLEPFEADEEDDDTKEAKLL